jgi:hypothetical protein
MYRLLDTLTGENVGHVIGCSRDIRTIAVPTRVVSDISVSLTMYRCTPTGLELLGAPIPGVTNDHTISSVSLSATGTIVAFGLERIGCVRVYTFDDVHGWQPMGPDIQSDDLGDGAGTAVSLSGDGHTLAIGADRYDGERGRVCVYSYDTGTQKWVPKHAATVLAGDTATGRFGHAVSLNIAGNILAVGASKGSVRIYTYDDGSGEWAATELSEPYERWTGESVSLDGAGQALAVGAFYNPPYGRISMFTTDGGAWSLSSSNEVDGGAGVQMGKSVSLSTDGQTMAVGGQGDVRMYTRTAHGEWVGGDLVAQGGWVEYHTYRVSMSGDAEIVVVGDGTTGSVSVYERWQTAVSVGDPYIFPVEGSPLKLPNVSTMYRLFQHRPTGTYIDIVVDTRSTNLPPRTVDGGLAVDKGYFITQLRVRGTTPLDIDTTTVQTLYRTDLAWTTGVCRGTICQGDPSMGGIFHGSYQSRTLAVDGLAEIELRLFDNPQILNGLLWKVPPRSCATGGLVYANYRPTLFDSGGKRRDIPFIPLPEHGRLLTQKTLVGRGEIPESVYTPLTFHQHFGGGT